MLDKKDKPVIPNCPRCGKIEFDISESNEHNGAAFINFIYCTNCGCVVGVSDQQLKDNLNYAIELLKKRSN